MPVKATKNSTATLQALSSGRESLVGLDAAYSSAYMVMGSPIAGSSPALSVGLSGRTVHRDLAASSRINDCSSREISEAMGSIPHYCTRSGVGLGFAGLFGTAHRTGYTPIKRVVLGSSPSSPPSIEGYSSDGRAPKASCAPLQFHQLRLRTVGGYMVTMILGSQRPGVNPTTVDSAANLVRTGLHTAVDTRFTNSEARFSTTNLQTIFTLQSV